MAGMTDGRIRVEKLHTFCVATMVKAGLREADARMTADVLVTTDTWGTFTHGTKHLRSYLRKARAGGIDLQAVPELIGEGPAWALVDGMIREIRGAPKAKGSDRIYLPGEMEWERRTDALANGIPLPPDVLASLQGLAEDVGLEGL